MTIKKSKQKEVFSEVEPEPEIKDPFPGSLIKDLDGGLKMILGIPNKSNDYFIHSATSGSPTWIAGLVDNELDTNISDTKNSIDVTIEPSPTFFDTSNVLGVPYPAIKGINVDWNKALVNELSSIPPVSVSNHSPRDLEEFYRTIRQKVADLTNNLYARTGQKGTHLVLDKESYTKLRLAIPHMHIDIDPNLTDTFFGLKILIDDFSEVEIIRVLRQPS